MPFVLSKEENILINVFKRGKMNAKSRAQAAVTHMFTKQTSISVCVGTGWEFVSVI